MPTKVQKKRAEKKLMYLLKKKKIDIINKTIVKKISTTKKLVSRQSSKQIKVKSLFPFRGNIEKWTNRLISVVKMPLGIARMKSDDILKFVMMVRKNNVQKYVTSISYLQKVIKKNIKHNVVIPRNEEIDFNLLCLILGTSQHTKSTEPFFADPVYNPLPNKYKKILEINEVGQIMNLFEPINNETSDTIME